MQLDQWLDENKVSAESFGRLLAMTGQAVRRYCAGERMPDAQTIELIGQVTNGAVTVNDLHQRRLKWLNHKQPSPPVEAA